MKTGRHHPPSIPEATSIVAREEWRLNETDSEDASFERRRCPLAEKCLHVWSDTLKKGKERYKSSTTGHRGHIRVLVGITKDTRSVDPCICKIQRPL